MTTWLPSARTNPHTRARTHARTRTFARKCSHAHAHARVHPPPPRIHTTATDTHTHAHARRHTHTHTHADFRRGIDVLPGDHVQDLPGQRAHDLPRRLVRQVHPSGQIKSSGQIPLMLMHARGRVGGRRRRRLVQMIGPGGPRELGWWWRGSSIDSDASQVGETDAEEANNAEEERKNAQEAKR